jgi:large subunit ribosomal protein L25
MNSTTLQAKPRTAKGKGAAGRLRRAGWVPAVVYGQGKPGRDIQLNGHDFLMTLRRHRSENMMVDLTVEGEEKPCKAMLKALQHDPITGRVIHADFCEVSLTKRIEIELPITLVGEAYGVLNEGGILEHVLRTLTVRCLANDLIEEVRVDVSGLHAGETLHVKDVQLDREKYEIDDDAEQVIAAIAVPRASETETEEAAEGAESAGPEVMTETKAAEKAAAEKADADKKK